MDRQIVYAGSIPLDTDLLSVQRNVQVGIGALARAILGPGPVVDGLQCVPSAAAYVVTMLPGSLTELAQNDYSAFGALPADPADVVRTALQPAASSVQLSPPADVNHVVCWLIQVQATEFDGTPIALPYWNASNPSVPYSGPGNSGSAQPTQRFLRVAISAKANGPQPWPIGTPPDADPGWIGLYAVTTVFNKPRIEAADIVPYYAAPRLRYTLPAMPPGVTQQAVFTTNNTWTAPDGVVWARVRVVGAGGGGGGGDTGYSGGGGGAGGYAEAVIGVTPQAAYGIEVGIGGGGGRAGRIWRGRDGEHVQWSCDGDGRRGGRVEQSGQPWRVAGKREFGDAPAVGRVWWGWGAGDADPGREWRGERVWRWGPGCEWGWCAGDGDVERVGWRGRLWGIGDGRGRCDWGGDRRVLSRVANGLRGNDGNDGEPCVAAECRPGAGGGRVRAGAAGGAGAASGGAGLAGEGPGRCAGLSVRHLAGADGQ